MGKKKLRSVPSCPDDVDGLRRRISKDLEMVYKQVREKKTNFMGIVQEYTAAFPQTGAMKKRVADVIALVGVDYDFDAWEGDPENGMFVTAIMQWSFEAKSMWRGTPKNKVVYKLAQSMAMVGFRQDRGRKVVGVYWRHVA